MAFFAVWAISRKWFAPVQVSAHLSADTKPESSVCDLGLCDGYTIVATDDPIKRLRVTFQDPDGDFTSLDFDAILAAQLSDELLQASVHIAPRREAASVALQPPSSAVTDFIRDNELENPVEIDHSEDILKLQGA